MPTFLRAGILQALLNAIATPFNSLFTSFRAWQADVSLQAAITCQVMYLEAILNYRLFGNFLRTIYITDGDGTTFDFIVNITPGATVNGQMLISLIEKYKLQGKRYQIGQSTVSYTTTWGDMVCQLQELVYTAEWSDPVCQQAVALQNNIIYWSNNAPQEIMVNAQYSTPARSTLTIEFQCNMSDGTTQFVYITLLPTDIYAYGNTTGKTATISSAVLKSITPSSDANYNYV